MVETNRQALSKGIRVVAADDDPIIRQLMESRLTGMGCRVFLAEDGAEAWQVIRQKKPDLVLVDLEMPTLDGFALIQSIRGHPRTKHLPVIVVTSRSDAAAIQEAFASGATSFLTKPVNWSTFEAHIQYLMRLTEAAASASSKARQAEAVARVKENSLRKAIAMCRSEMAEALITLDQLSADVHAGAPADQLMAAIDTLTEQCSALDAAMVQSQRLNTDLCEQIQPGDTQVPVLNVLANAQTFVGPLSQSRDVPISVVMPPEDVYIACDAENLSAAVGHLLENAVKYSPPGKTVLVEVAVHDDFMLTISITDDGPGMDPEFYSKRLQQSVTELTVAENQGMGLSVVRAIIEAHGGALEIRSMPGQGTTAMLVVPADRVNGEAVDAA